MGRDVGKNVYPTGLTPARNCGIRLVSLKIADKDNLFLLSVSSDLTRQEVGDTVLTFPEASVRAFVPAEAVIPRPSILLLQHEAPFRRGVSGLPLCISRRVCPTAYSRCCVRGTRRHPGSFSVVVKLDVEDVLFDAPAVVVAATLESESVERFLCREVHGKVVAHFAAVHMTFAEVLV